MIVIEPVRMWRRCEIVIVIEVMRRVLVEAKRVLKEVEVVPVEALRLVNRQESACRGL